MAGSSSSHSGSDGVYINNTPVTSWARAAAAGESYSGEKQLLNAVQQHGKTWSAVNSS